MTLSPLDSIRFASTHKPKNSLAKAAAVSAMLATTPAALAQDPPVIPGDTVTLSEMAEAIPTANVHVLASSLHQPDPDEEPPAEGYLERTKQLARQIDIEHGEAYMRQLKQKFTLAWAKLGIAMANDTHPEMIQEAARVQQLLPKLQGHGWVLDVLKKDPKALSKGPSCDVDLTLSIPNMPEMYGYVCEGDKLALMKTPDGKLVVQEHTGRFKNIHFAEVMPNNKGVTGLQIFDKDHNPLGWYSSEVPTLDNEGENPIMVSLNHIGELKGCNKEKVTTFLDRPNTPGWYGGTDTTRPGWPVPIPYGGNSVRVITQYIYVPGETRIIEKPGNCEKPPTGTVPEPDTWSMLGLGGALMWWQRRKQAKASKS